MEQSDLERAAGGIPNTWKLALFQPPIPWSLVACFIATLCGWYYYSWTYGYFKRMGLSGPIPLPFMGNSLDFFSKSLARVDLENVKTYGKVYGAFRGREPVLSVADPDMVKDILVKEFSSFINRPPFLSRVIFSQPAINRGLFSIHDDHWKHVRATLSPTFTSGKLKQMLPTIDDCSKVLMSYLDCRRDSDINVREILSAYALDVIAGTAFGLDIRSLDSPRNPALKHLGHLIGVGRKLQRTLAVSIGLASPSLIPFLYKLGVSFFDQAGLQYFENVVLRVLESKDVAEERQNFITLCRGDRVNINQVDQSSVKSTLDGKWWTTEGLTSEEIVSNALLFLQAGLDTESAFLTFFCYAMAVNQQVQQRVYDELVEKVPQAEITYKALQDMHYLDMCIDETLRMYPPVLRLQRYCNKDVDVGGIRATKRLSISILVYALHHDPVHWPEPYTFRPDRFLPEEKAKRHSFAYLPFGAGPRNCIGQRLALLEAKAAVVKILAKYQICPCESTPSPPLMLGVGLDLVPQKPIILRFSRRTAQE